MKVATSYFYQIRNFKRNMIPLSTAVWDPKWFHKNKGQNYIYLDKRGIINGLRLNAFIFNEYNGQEDFFPAYQRFLDAIDLKPIIVKMEQLEKIIQLKLKIKEELIFVLIVYETSSNPDSERPYLIKKFNSNGIKCNELNYPIV